MWYGYTVYPPA